MQIVESIRYRTELSELSLPPRKWMSSLVTDMIHPGLLAFDKVYQHSEVGVKHRLHSVTVTYRQTCSNYVILIISTVSDPVLNITECYLNIKDAVF
jgi:hypothetical protein